MTNPLDKAVINHAFARIAKAEGRRGEAVALIYEAAASYAYAGRDSFAIKAVAEVAGLKEAKAYRAKMQIEEHRIAEELMEGLDSSL